jgi:hypothetical protein
MIKYAQAKAAQQGRQPDRPIGRAQRRPHAFSVSFPAKVLSRRRAAGYANRRPAAALSPSYVGGGWPPDGAAESSVRLWR